MELKEFKIYKSSGTYSETIEAYGVANLLNEIFIRNNTVSSTITIEDNDLFYSIKVNKPITSGMISKLTYFPIVKFIKNNDKTEVPEGISDYFNYPAQKKIVDDYKQKYNSINNNTKLNQEQKRHAREELTKKRLSEFGDIVNPEFDVFREIIGNPYASFMKLFDNFYQNQDNFQILIKEILAKYSQCEKIERDFRLVDENPTAQQLYNPNQGKGLNKAKANNASMGNLNSNWISETMKISGALSMMTCQYVNVGSTYDLKIYVPEFNQITLSKARAIFFEFKKYLKSSTPIKLDILNSLNLSINFIQQTPEYNRGKIKNTVRGFHSVYQKNLGQNKAVANISFINTPDFINYTTREQGKDWIDILEDQKKIISGIKELGDSIQGLQAYRDFLGSIGKSALENFNKFSYWYSSYLTQSLSKEKSYVKPFNVKPFNVETLNKFYINMNTTELNLKEIIENEGFKAVAKAIRNSTIRLQIKSKFQETHKKFQIRYGFAQQLANKSKSKIDFVQFISEFLGKYDAETASHKEKNPNVIYRSNVREEEKDLFYNLVEKYSNSISVIGALLSSYGFALERYNENDEERVEKLNKEAEALGYQLIKIDRSPEMENSFEDETDNNEE